MRLRLNQLSKSKPRCTSVIASVSEAIHRAANGEGWIASELTLLVL